MATGKRTLNKVQLIGRLGGDPDLKYTPSGIAVANFSMATNRVWKDQEGNQQEETDWHRIVLWRKLAEIAAEYLYKGSQVYIEGRLQTRSWEDDSGKTNYMTEVIAEILLMLGSKNNRQNTYQEEPADMAPRDEISQDNQQSGNDELPAAPQEDDLPF